MFSINKINNFLNFQQGQEFFLVSTASRLVQGPLNLRSKKILGLFSSGENDFSFMSNTKVKNSSTSPNIFTVRCLIKHRNNVVLIEALQRTWSAFYSRIALITKWTFAYWHMILDITECSTSTRVTHKAWVHAHFIHTASILSTVSVDIAFRCKGWYLHCNTKHRNVIHLNT